MKTEMNEEEFKNVSIVVQVTAPQQTSVPQNMLEHIVFVEPQVLPVPDGMCKTCYDIGGKN